MYLKKFKAEAGWQGQMETHWVGSLLSCHYLLLILPAGNLYSPTWEFFIGLEKQLCIYPVCYKFNNFPDWQKLKETLSLTSCFTIPGKGSDFLSWRQCFDWQRFSELLKVGQFTESTAQNLKEDRSYHG